MNKKARCAGQQSEAVAVLSKSNFLSKDEKPAGDRGNSAFKNTVSQEHLFGHETILALMNDFACECFSHTHSE